MSTSSNNRLPFSRDSESCASQDYADSHDRILTKIPAVPSADQGIYTAPSSVKKKVRNVKRSKKEVEALFISSGPKFEDFITPDKLALLRDKLTSFAEQSTTKNIQRRNVSFRLVASNNPSSSTRLERDLFKTGLTCTTERKAHVTIDPTKILKEKQNLLQTTGCSSIREFIEKSKAGKSPSEIKISEEVTPNVLSKDEDPQHRPETKNPPNYEKSNSSTSEDRNRRVSADDTILNFGKRNYAQLNSLPTVQAHREEEDSPEHFNGKTMRRAKSDILPRTITFLDTKRQKHMRFPVFLEDHLKFINPDMKNSIHDADADDDIETDDEQLHLASAKVFEDLLEALTANNTERKVYKPRRDLSVLSKNIMSYFVCQTNGDTAAVKSSSSICLTQESQAKTLSSASTSDRSLTSWRPYQDLEYKDQSSQKDTSSVPPLFNSLFSFGK